VWLLTTVTHGITRLLRVGDVTDDAITAEELRILVERGGELGTIEAEEEQMIGGILELGEQRAHEVMVARVDMVSLAVDASLSEIIEIIVSEGHSRIPVYDGNIDNIVGLLYAKDLLPYLVGEDRPPSIRRLLRTPLFVPESMLVDDLLRSLQRRRVHIAVVLDEHGGTAGLVTIEDLLEEIVGEIQDEYDEEEPMIVALGDHDARIDGRADVDDMLEHFDSTLEGDDQEEFDTVGGLVYHHIGGVPKVGDKVVVDGLELTVEATDGRRVRTVHVVHTPPVEDDESEEEQG
jgi:putative hemolysin